MEKYIVESILNSDNSKLLSLLINNKDFYDKIKKSVKFEDDPIESTVITRLLSLTINFKRTIDYDYCLIQELKRMLFQYIKLNNDQIRMLINDTILCLSNKLAIGFYQNLSEEDLQCDYKNY